MDIILEKGVTYNNVCVEDLGRLVELGLLPRFYNKSAYSECIPTFDNKINLEFCPKTVKIGNQVWMAENLAIDDGGEGIYHNPDNNETYYTWKAAMRVAKSIPGWHLPTALEWNEAALACGATEEPYEDGSDPNFNDYRNVQELKDKLGVKLAGSYYGSFFNVGSNAYFWTSTENSSTGAYSRDFSTGTSMDSYYYNKSYGSSVRLVKDSA